MSTISVTLIEQFFTDLHSKLPGIANVFNDSVFEVKQLVQEAEYELDEISKSNEVKRVNEVKISFKHLKYTTEAIYTYLDKVDDLFWKIKNKAPTVIQDAEEGNVKSVVQLIVEINQTIQDCKEKCALLLERCREFATSCDRAERECRRLENEAEGKQKIARRVGGAATAGVAAAGTTASVLVGVFTFGVGFAVGLPLTIAATAATTTAAGATTLILSHKYGKAADAFGKLGRRFKRLRSNIDTTQERIDEIMSIPGINLEFNEQITITITTSTARISLIRILRTTLDESTALYNKTSSGRNITAQCKESLSVKYESIY